MTERDVFVPVWNNRIGDWEPVDFRHGQRVGQWPAGFNPQLLPVPEYSDGDRVQFVRDECCAREGTVRMILFQGDLSKLQEERDSATHYADLDAGKIIYIVTARGHDHRIIGSQILGRFVSPQRNSFALPLQE
ncbi:MAG TPA: hypothetical protein VKV20_12770 [Ktedonobacteraceae bacterium]|jgi:hypothetical protein|nr:hypothetical protein [Ktedonobacteraceae bacterium]